MFAMLQVRAGDQGRRLFRLQEAVVQLHLRAE